MAFSFGFSGDDIEEDPNEALHHVHQVDSADSPVPPPIPAQAHTLDELLSTLPDKISYSTVQLNAPDGSSILLPRRELFDVRLQLMAEDDGTSSTPLSGLDGSDLHPNIYEGGYKTWECSLDLARYLARPSSSTQPLPDHVIEMGCGSALPSLVLFQHALRQSHRLHLTLTDYNASVLRLVTLPNLLLTWCATLSPTQTAALFPETNPETDANPLLHLSAAAPDEQQLHGDLYLSPALVAAFKASLQATHISLTLLSGAWTPLSTFLPLVPEYPDRRTLVLASETIYSAASLTAFTAAMVALMRRVGSASASASASALVAAKKVYFGVGGSVDGFREECRGCGAVVEDVEGGEGEEGVRRWMGEVRIGE